MSWVAKVSVRLFNHSQRHMATLSFLGQETAQKVDEELMGPLKFSIDQLMELAGLSVACSVHDAFLQDEPNKKVLVVCGPGSNTNIFPSPANLSRQWGRRIGRCEALGALWSPCGRLVWKGNREATIPQSDPTVSGLGDSVLLWNQGESSDSRHLALLMLYLRFRFRFAY